MRCTLFDVVGDGVWFSATMAAERSRYRCPYWTAGAYYACCEVYRSSALGLLDANYDTLRRLTLRDSGMSCVLEYLLDLFDTMEKCTRVRLAWLRHATPSGRGVLADCRPTLSSALGAFYLVVVQPEAEPEVSAKLVSPRKQDWLTNAVLSWFAYASVHVDVRNVLRADICRWADHWSRSQLVSFSTWVAVQTLGVLAIGLDHGRVLSWCRRVAEELRPVMQRLFVCT